MKNLEYCSFCGSHKEEVKKLIVDDTVAICSNCVDLCNILITDDDLKPDSSLSSDKQFDAYSIKEHLDKYVIGQEHAKEVLSVALANHYKRINYPSPNIELNKGNVLLWGPTGTGKTLLAKSIAKFMNVPFAIADATSLTEAGYVGEDVENMITMLYTNANNDVYKAETGIVFIDELDKIARKSENPSITRDVSGEGVQQALLKLIEGTICKINLTNKRKNPYAECIEIDTKNILFIAGGSFVGLDKIINNRVNEKSMGFGATVTSNTEITNQMITSADLTAFGLIPELIGRFTTTAVLDNLTVDQLIEVMQKAKNNYLDQYKYLFSIDGITLHFSDDAIKYIAEKCIELKIGVRGIHTELETILMPHMFHMRNYKDQKIKKIIIDIELAMNPKPLFK